MTLFDRNQSGRRKPLAAVVGAAPQAEYLLDQRREYRRESDVRIDLAMEALEGGFWHYDIASRTFETSPHLARFIAGPNAAPLDHDQYVARIAMEDRHHADLEPVIASRTERSVAEYRMTMHDGRVRWMRCTRRVIRDANGRASRMVGIAVDVTEQKWLQAHTEEQAKTDALTGLGNRRFFEERAAALLARAQNARTPFGIGVLMIDLDRFKPINDRYGHLAGDRVIQMVAKRLATAVRPIDIVARLGGDEFAVLVDDPDADSLAVLAKRLSIVIGDPMAIDGHTLSVGGSVGASLYRPGDATVQEIVRRADEALYDCKRSKGHVKALVIAQKAPRRSRVRAVH